MASFSGAVSNYYGRYFSFGGRSDLSQYWWVFLYILVVEGLLTFFMYMCRDGSFGYYFWYVLLWLFGVVNFFPSLTLGVRRLHDSGRGGGWILINLVPFIGNIWFLILMLLPSQGANRFGAPVDGD